MPAYFDKERKTWFCKFYYKDYTGQQKQKCKRGFAKKSDAQQFERDFLVNLSATANVTFETLRNSYIEYKSSRVKASTLKTLKYCLTGQIGPYFDNKLIKDITPADVMHWQNEMIASSRKETTTPKTSNSVRTISIPHEVMDDLKDYTSRIYDITDTNQLFFMEYQAITRYKNAVCKEYNIRQIRIHDLRHSHVSLLIHLDCSIMMIADRIGDTPATVQSTYAHLYPEKKDAILEKLEKIVSE